MIELLFWSLIVVTWIAVGLHVVKEFVRFKGERITKFRTKYDEQAEVRKICRYHGGLDRAIWTVDIVEPAQ